MAAVGVSGACAAVRAVTVGQTAGSRTYFNRAAAQRQQLASVAGIAVFADVVPSTASRLADRAVTAG